MMLKQEINFDKKKKIIYIYVLKYPSSREINATFLGTMTSSYSAIGEETGRLSTISLGRSPSSLDAARLAFAESLFAFTFCSSSLQDISIYIYIKRIDCLLFPTRYIPKSTFSVLNSHLMISRSLYNERTNESRKL